MPRLLDAFHSLKIGISGTESGMLKPFNDLAAMILNLGASLEGISNLIAAVTYILGVLLIAKGIFRLRVMADQRSQMHQPMELGGPLISLLIGGMLIWSNTLLDSMTQTMWGTTSPLDYTPSLTGDYIAVWDVILKIMQIIGFIAFIRGWYYLTRVGQQSQPGMVGKGLTHIIGGTMAYHMGATINVLMTTFGFDWT